VEVVLVVQRAQVVTRLERVAQPLVQVEHLVLVALAAASENKLLKKNTTFLGGVLYLKTCVTGRHALFAANQHMVDVENTSNKF
jgi:hypothetical protein